MDDTILDTRSADPAVVLVAGKIGSGKSTALNNIFDLNLEARSSPSSVTQVVHKEVVKKNRRSFCVVDSPGLGGVGLPTKSVVKQMVAAVKGSDFMLLYCLPVKPSDTLTETDRSIIMTMKSYFGNGVWDKCVLLLTFSDIAKRHFKDSSDTNSYNTYLQGHIQAFFSVLKSCGARISEIKLVMEGNVPELEPLQKYCSGKIVAVPMMNVKSGEVTISPNCSELAFDGIVKMSQLAREEEDGCSKAFRRCLISVGGAAVGCFCGACGYLWFILVSCLGALIMAVVNLIRMDKKEHKH